MAATSIYLVRRALEMGDKSVHLIGSLYRVLPSVSILRFFFRNESRF